MYELQQVVKLLLRISRSYGVVRNSRAACWRWLFQTEITAIRLFTVFQRIRQTAPTFMVQRWGV